jgi:hypothetical protein
MARRLAGINVLLGLAATGLLGYSIWEFTQPLPEPSVRARPTPAPNLPAPAPAPPQTPPAAYQGIASRNLFSPTRTEAPPAPVASAPVAPPQPKPNLYGVVLRDEASIAYLEDPTTKRVAGYRVGDSVAGGTVQRIAADRVVLARPDGPLDVRLHDPSKPKPPPPATAQPPGAPGAGAPGGPAPGRPALPTPAGVGPVPGAQPPAAGVFPPGRRLPPSLLRRLPPQAGGAPANAGQ